MDSNTQEKFSDFAWKNSAEIIEKCLNHPFNTEMAFGKLPREKFNNYIVQDMRYLYLLSREMAKIAEQLTDQEKICHRFCIFAEGSLEYEHQLQQELVGKYDIALAQYPSSSKGVDEYIAYTSSFLKDGRLEEAIASHLPCFWIYYEVGRHLMDKLQESGADLEQIREENPLCLSWIESYSADEFRKDAYDYIQICDDIAQGAVSPEGTDLDDLRNRMAEAFRKACAYEVAFWDECYAYGAATPELKEIGEFGFIRRFTPKFSHLLEGKEVVGIGDDCAILNTKTDYEYLVSTDMLNEGIHFIKKDIDPFQLGYKSVAVNISDIAAMGGEPIGTFLSIGIPSTTSMEFLDRFMEGYHQISDEFGVPLLGGDTTRAVNELTINVGVIGRARKGTAVLRSGAKVGDYVCVTGFLGDSAAGLKLVLERLKEEEMMEGQPSGKLPAPEEYLLSRHYKPSPRIAEGMFLAECGAHSMMDISDGIASDLTHILKASAVSARVDLDDVPLSRQLQEVAADFDWKRTDLAVSGGEDYELLLTMRPQDYESCRTCFSEKFGIPLTAIGEIVAPSEQNPEGKIVWCRGDKVLSLDKKGFNHFN